MAAFRLFGDEVGEKLRNRIEAAGNPPQITVGSDIIFASIALPQFYERRVYNAAWSRNNVPSPLVSSYLSSLEQAWKDGLRPQDYHLAALSTLIEKIQQRADQRPCPSADDLVDLDLLLTDSFLVYSSHLFSGKVNPESINAEWKATRREGDMGRILEEALEKKSISESLQTLLPQYPGYFRLRQALLFWRGQSMRTDAGQLLSPGPKIQKGDRGEQVASLRNRLKSIENLETGVPGKVASDDVFDEELEESAMGFQRRHGLEPDGVVGMATLNALNTPPEERLKQIELNLERWRWLPHELGRRYILINIANFELDVVEEDVRQMTMRVVVGSEFQRTPVFSDQMTYVVFNPYWNIPTSIAVKEVIPSVRKDPDYLTKQNIKLIRDRGAGEEEVNPQTIDWSTMNTRNLSFRFRQESGAKNSLGQAKFMFPNKFSVYLHGTPSMGLFSRSERALSHGCIRVEKPVELAEFLLRYDPAWTRERILSTIASNKELTVQLPKPYFVHLLYWTSWAEEDGTIHFRKDIYQRDQRLLAELREAAPAVPAQRK
ncbi:MAG: L,D-transpeptidase family protein [Candidatus Aminicenantes bacterium]|nr:L,D-transpeptidase family protein [Candidatus Aminicenantes bacterium]